MSKNRPVFLDLTAIKFPIIALASITHRVSGIGIFILLAYLFYLLDLSLSSPEGFAEASALVAAPVSKFVLWVVLSAFIYHLVAGIKHLFADLGYGETLEAARLGSQLVIGISAVLIVLAGVWLW